jgi:endonuclease/exonuclease/phosphatase family metal-dependent hydrolase
MSSQLKLIQLNIEFGKHIDQTLPFFTEQQADVVCLQELPQHLVHKFEEVLGATSVYTPMALYQGEVRGVGIFSKYPITKHTAEQYGGNREKESLSVFDQSSYEARHNTSRFILLTSEIEKDAAVFHIATTHFPVTERGSVTDFQRQDMQALLRLLKEKEEFVLTGDFNAPRGGEIFAALAAVYKDNMPQQYKTSIDINLHRHGKTSAHELADKMVDGIFSTPAYQVSDVQIISGVSDHCAFVATIAKD